MEHPGHESGRDDPCPVLRLGRQRRRPFLCQHVDRPGVPEGTAPGLGERPAGSSGYETPTSRSSTPSPRAPISSQRLELACRVGKVARTLTWARAVMTSGADTDAEFQRAPLESLGSLLDDSYPGSRLIRPPYRPRRCPTAAAERRLADRLPRRRRAVAYTDRRAPSFPRRGSRCNTNPARRAIGCSRLWPC